MFNNPSKSDSFKEEGSVTEVDSIRKMCRVKTLSGQNLDSVPWTQPSGGASRSGDRITPVLGDRVIIDSGLGYPVIVMFLPKLQSSENTFPLSINTGEILIDTGNFSSAGKNVIGDQNSPKDMVVGDRILSSPGGGLVALLRAGSLLFRSSRFSEIYLCKLQDLVRISSRNFEHFTDVSSDVIRNIKGRIYRYSGYSKKISDAKVEDYTYNQYIGDVALAEEFKTDYNKSSSLPVETDILYKEQVLQSSAEVMKRELHLDGTQDIVVSGSGNFTRIKSTNGEIVITFNDINVIKINTDEISFKKNGDTRSIIITDNSLLSTFQGGTILMEGSSITSTFGGAVHKLNNEGVSSSFGGHFVNVTSSGVALG